MKLAEKFAKESTISLVGVTFGNINRYLFTIIIARWAGVQMLGIYSLANSILMIAESIAKLGLERGVLRHVGMLNIEEEPGKIRTLVAAAVKMTGQASMILSLVIILLSGWFVSNVLNAAPQLRTVLTVFALVLPLNAITNVGAFATQGLKLLKYKVIVTQIVYPSVLVIGSGLLLLYWSDVRVIIIPVVIAAVISLIIILIFLKKLLGLKSWHVLTASWDKALLVYSLPLMFIGILQTVMHWMDILMLGHYTNAIQVGLYHPAVRTAGLMQAVILSLMSIYTPLAAQLFGQKDEVGLTRLFKQTTRWLITLSLPIALIFLIYPSKVMLIFGAEYLSSAPVLMILAAATFMQVVGSSAAPIIAVTGHTKLSLANSIIGLILNVILNVFLIPEFGIMGAGIATFISISFISILRNIEVLSLFQITMFSRPLFKPFLAGLGLAIFLVLIKPLIMPFHTLITGAIVVLTGVPVYGLLLYLLKLEPEDREFISGIKILKNIMSR
ncbi:MAG: flippase [Candidatus Marinimicrobia bacterium]|nr:flippase [Candidatus Neomarinimicrobiota bacterium]